MLFKLTEVMCQRGDSQLIDILNNFGRGDVQSDNINILKSRVIQPGAEDYPHSALHIFEENSNANRYIDEMLYSNKNKLFTEKSN